MVQSEQNLKCPKRPSAHRERLGGDGHRPIGEWQLCPCLVGRDSRFHFCKRIYILSRHFDIFDRRESGHQINIRAQLFCQIFYTAQILEGYPRFCKTTVVFEEDEGMVKNWARQSCGHANFLQVSQQNQEDLELREPIPFSWRQFNVLSHVCDKS
jgi:hypothetical protein